MPSEEEDKLADLLGDDSPAPAPKKKAPARKTKAKAEPEPEPAVEEEEEEEEDLGDLEFTKLEGKARRDSYFKKRGGYSETLVVKALVSRTLTCGFEGEENSWFIRVHKGQTYTTYTANMIHQFHEGLVQVLRH